MAVLMGSKVIVYHHFGGHKYEISCRYCKFHAFQEEPLKTKTKEMNTPLLFCARKDALEPNCSGTTCPYISKTTETRWILLSYSILSEEPHLRESP